MVIFRSDDVAELDKYKTNDSSQSADNSKLMNALNGFAPVLSRVSKELRCIFVFKGSL